MSKSDDTAVAEFLAKRGATRVPEGKGALNLSARDWRRKVRGEPTEDELIRARRVVIDHAGREHVQNGLGEWIS